MIDLSANGTDFVLTLLTFLAGAMAIGGWALFITRRDRRPARPTNRAR